MDRDTINLFPSANITFNLSDKSLVRLAYGMTINRPEFREIAPFYYVDFDMNAGIYGAPNIRQAYIHNYDLRWEYYPADGESVNLGVFYKNFIHPIEQIILGNNPTQYSFENVNSAYSAGIEAELRKSLDFIPALKNFTAVINASLIKSSCQVSNPVHFHGTGRSKDSPLILLMPASSTRTAKGPYGQRYVQYRR